jgi:hypothetical protein
MTGGARTCEKRCIQGFGGQPDGNRQFGRHKPKWEDNIKMDLEELGWKGVDCIDLAQDMYIWWAVVNTVLNIRVS